MDERERHSEFAAPVNDGGVSNYIKQICRIPLLSPEEERKLAYRIRKGDGSARRKMILSNLRLVVSIAKKFSGLGVPLQDLIEEGNMGLMKAVEKFDPDRGTKFSTYATWWIQQHIIRALTSQSRTMRVPAYVSELMTRARKAMETHLVSTGKTIGIEELAQSLGISDTEAEQIVRYLEIDETFSAQQNAYTLEQLETGNTNSLPIGKCDVFASISVVHDLRTLISFLPEKLAEVVSYRYGLQDGKPHTIQETADQLNIPREQVRRYERRAISLLREFIVKNRDKAEV